MFWNKKKKINQEFEDAKDMIRIKKSLGANCIYIPISAHITDNVKQWCAQENYQCEVDHIDEDGVMFYKIWGWE